MGRGANDPLPLIPDSSSSGSEKPRVKALYNHQGEGSNQLTFTQGDILLLYGEKRDGWHYGQNTRTKGLVLAILHYQNNSEPKQQ